MLRCRSVGKEFYYYYHRKISLRERFIHLVSKRELPKPPTFSLADLTLSVYEGESVALIGANGSGKSTALRIMAGIYQPTSGELEVFGRTTAVIEVGAGFHGDLTGAENIRLYGSIMGLTRRQLEDHMVEIIDFSGVREFIDVPVKYFSSGMFARLAFSIAICTKPDLLLLDEVLAVGDEEFRARCLESLRRFSGDGGTLITASHDLGAIRDLCTSAVWLESGRQRLTGDVSTVLAAYQDSIVA